MVNDALNTRSIGNRALLVEHLKSVLHRGIGQGREVHQ